MKQYVFLSVVLTIWAVGHCELARAWDSHALGTRLALEVMPEVKFAPPVKTESLESFLAALRWDDRHPSSQSDASFAAFLRVNPNAKLALYARQIPGDAAATEGHKELAVEAVTLLPGQLPHGTVFVALEPGDEISAIEVVSTASDEPDYGLDISLFEDSGTPYGAAYGFGKQPFGNASQELSSQAPFHMGFFHEAGIVFTAAPFLKRTNSQYRLKQYFSLARMAFQSGHPYWGWRFTGWALHYVQDLTQPYHARVLPGVSAAKMIWINLLDSIGVHNPKDGRVQLVTNRHLALENYADFSIVRALEATGATAPTGRLAKALENTDFDESVGPFDLATTPVMRITKDSSDLASATDRAISSALPKRLVSDTSYIYNVTEPAADTLPLVDAGPEKPRAELDAVLEKLLTNFGAHTRNFVRLILK